ncbi:unnamed protein product [marine sediment metagenome]|uniref:Uncharacterized protein n=1 Tax=marine sediment metagenome TaxID=412755 RepID=X1LWX3_9ZZZZ
MKLTIHTYEGYTYTRFEKEGKILRKNCGKKGSYQKKNSSKHLKEAFIRL